MQQIKTTIDEQFAFISTNLCGFPIISRVEIVTGVTVEAYAPGAGTVLQVAQHPTDPDIMYFYGDAGGGTNLIRHTVSTITNDSIGPVTTETVTGFEVNPSDDQQLTACFDLLGLVGLVVNTIDGGASYTTWNSTSVLAPTDLATLWSGEPKLNRYFISGDDGANTKIRYSPNEGAEEVERKSGPPANTIIRMVFTDGQ